MCNTVFFLFLSFCFFNGYCDGIRQGPGVCKERRSRTIGGKITQKEFIICCPKYEYVYELDICKPICSFGCDGGKCVNPDECQCDPPLVLNDTKNKCITPVCEPKCVNAICQNTNECICNYNYTTYNSSHCIPDCQDGYEINNETFDTCLPKCSRACMNGICSAPEQCSCFEGYELSGRDNYTCEHSCTPKCVNAECVAHNKCECHDGYINVDGVCKAECQSCEFGECISPDVCICYPGYERQYNSCVPLCQPQCLHGVCFEPNKCLCDPGYVFREEIKNCGPVCDTECINSVCKAPNICVCLEGYDVTLETGVCKVKCENCLNGTCIEPNICICDQGYEKVDTICKPVCKDTCTNGYCLSPDVCSCNDGFRMENNSCIPKEQVDCKSCDGKCVEGTCYCLDRRPCYLEPDMPAEVQSLEMAGLEVTWLVGGSVGLLLLIFIVAVTRLLWKRKEMFQTERKNDKRFDNVVYTVPDPQINNNNNIVQVEETSFIEKKNDDYAMKMD